jgi:hypothetical protein
MVHRSDLTDEEWEMLQRLNRGAPESDFIPGTILERFAELGLALSRGGRARISERGKQLILRSRDRHRL